MDYKWIKNSSDLAADQGKELALKIADAGLEAIATERVVASSLKIHGNTLHIKGEEIDLSGFKRILVVGFGKASAEAAMALERVLDGRITAGAVIDIVSGATTTIKSFVGTHPRPSLENVAATKNIIELASGISEEDLVIVIVSGGGSALLCYPESECEANAKLYEKFLPTGATIEELNLVRKHLSSLKGGGLAKIFYPATIVGLIFSDVPGEHDEIVASGPTFKDESTMDFAKGVLRKYGIQEEEFEFTETPKEDKYFEKVTNITLVSNELALAAMKKEAEGFGLKTRILSAELYDNAAMSMEKMVGALSEADAVLAAGETSLKVDKKGGSGGRNLYLALEALRHLSPGMEFIALASDGLDNSDAAGAIVDTELREKAEAADLNVNEYLANFDPYTFFKKVGGVIMTGPTGANISDLMILIKKQ